ncbi:sigma-70 family RNA polymerase sigma factor [Lysobacter silvisoli]|uniref:RNA polymerase subunit sigma n=1 Tax=Lysobacter silvisoli TaxID=2293254 RepID=A0A371K2C5_9GAMM|nr:sigma-70 family RNA polymerase sigma factor [Lysobacter silvisoli]RDZ28071.1 RNA polymerase subunit sigma [Lysobacter silvisoli]
MSAPVTDACEAKDWSGEMAAVAQRRDRDSFMRIYDHFMPRLCLYLRGIGAPASTAEDLAQESLLRLWQRAAHYDPARSAVSTWLFRIARNLQIDQLRRDAGRAPAAQDALDAAPDGSACTAEDYADQVQLQRRIDDLSPVQARLIRMSYFEAKTHQEIAAELGLPLGTVKSHLRRAFLRLQGQLGAAP